MTIDKIKLQDEFIITNGEQDFYTKIGQKIRDIRTSKNISQAELAKSLNTTSEFIEAYENATVAIPIYHFMELCKIMDCYNDFDNVI
ncbi:MAG: helix-turn-helix transcriptional regulator [Alphaproteobacteria bacterium]|nr:helix-turn-helix transcriptional regulator [Alphaproteobacteria bacterium]